MTCAENRRKPRTKRRFSGRVQKLARNVDFEVVSCFCVAGAIDLQPLAASCCVFFCESHCQRCAQWCQSANFVAGVAFSFISCHIPFISIHFPSISIHFHFISFHFPFISFHFPFISIHFPFISIHFPFICFQFPFISIHFLSFPFIFLPCHGCGTWLQIVCFHCVHDDFVWQANRFAISRSFLLRVFLRIALSALRKVVPK